MTTVVEHAIRRAPLAVRLTDLASGEPVADGITVDIWPLGQPSEAVTVRPTAGGVAGVHHLRGLREYEDGSTPRASWFASPLASSPLDVGVRVRDNTHQHLPVVATVLAPSAGVVAIALPRSPGAPLPTNTLAVCAELRTEAGSPAAHAVVELACSGVTVGGIADARGVVVVSFPRSVDPTAVGSGAGGPVWTLTVRVRYRVGGPVGQQRHPDARDDDPPTLASILGQPVARVSDAGAFATSLTRNLDATTPLVLASGAQPPLILTVRPDP